MLTLESKEQMMEAADQLSLDADERDQAGEREKVDPHENKPGSYEAIMRMFAR